VDRPTAGKLAGQAQVLSNLFKKIDEFLSPPPNFVNLTYTDRFGKYAESIQNGQNVVSNLGRILPLGYMLFASKILFPVAWILKKFGFRFIDIDLTQIGSIIYLDVLLKEDAITCKTPRWKMLALASHYTDGNSYLIDLYQKHIVLIRNPVFKFILSPFFVSDVFDDNSFKYDSVYHTENKTHEIWREYSRQISAPLVGMPAADVEKVKKILGKYWSDNRPFVTVHVRDTGFYNISSQVNRNGNILDYKAAIDFLIESGYRVVRIGDKSAADIKGLIEECGPMLFDYAHSDIKSEMIDAFLLSQCAFFIGLASGPASIPSVFNVRSCNVNWFNASTGPWFVEGDLVTIKKFRYKSDNRLVKFPDLFKPPYSMNPSVTMMDAHGVYMEGSTEEEILETVKEFLSGAETSDVQTRAKKMVLPDNYAFGAQGNFSNVTLRTYLGANAFE